MTLEIEKLQESEKKLGFYILEKRMEELYICMILTESNLKDGQFQFSALVIPSELEKGAQR